MDQAQSTWWRALRAYSFSATIIPVLCAFLFVHATGRGVDWLFFPLMLSSALLLHAGVNLLNDYYDFILGFDTPAASGSSGLLTQGIVAPNYMLRWGQFYVVAGAVAGLILAASRGWALLPAGATAIAGSWFYSHRSGYKYKGIGEPLVFILMGPLLFCSAGYAACGTVTVNMLIFSLPFGALVTAILLANNIRDVEMDSAAGFMTLPMRIGLPSAKRLFAGLLATAFLIPALLTVFRPATFPSLLFLLSLPLAGRLTRQVQQARTPQTDLQNAPQQTAALYLLFGILLAVGLFLCKTPGSA